jgi:hypothetical protein
MEKTMTSAANDEVTGLPVDAEPVLRLAQRDGAIALAALSLWAAADTWHATTGLGFALLLSILNGGAVGYGLARMAHEWGHIAGARWSGGIAPTRPIDSLFPIFTFDMERSEPSAFRAMSVGGNVGHWLVVLLLAALIPLDTAGRVALLSGALSVAISASLTEFPVIQRAYAGASAAESFQGLTGAKLKRNRWLGVGAGLLLFLLVR